ncbi:MAG: transposase [Acidobacteriota bacterium]
MIDFPIDELLDEEECANWLEKHLHPAGLKCPRCGDVEKRIAQRGRYWVAYRCKSCDRYYSLLTGTVFEKTRQPPSKIVMLLRGIAKGEPTARLSRELGIGRFRLHELRCQIQQHLASRRTNTPLTDRVLEADELYQNAGEKKRPTSRSLRSPAQTG